MKKNMKKGFTITELVIVIAVIAVLAAVMIPTFASIVKKAKQSADQQAVTTMNKVLSVETDTPDSISEVIALLAEESLDIEDYKPLTKDTYFYWVKSENAIVIANSSNEVVYPKDLTDITKSAGDWYTLSGETPEDNSWVENVTAEGAVTIANGEQFVSLMKEITDGNKADDVKTISLTGDIDVMGSTYNFGKVTEDLTINGNGNTIYGLRSDQNNYYSTQKAYEDKGYYYGLIPNIAAGKTVTVSGLTISGMTVKDTNNENTGCMAFIAGVVNKGATLNVSNVTIENSTIMGDQRVASVAGLVYGNVNMTNVVVKNNTIKGNMQAAVLFGTLMNSATFTYTNLTVENNKVEGYSQTEANGYKVVSNFSNTDTATGNTTKATDQFVTCAGMNVSHVSPSEFVAAGCTQEWYWFKGTEIALKQRSYDAAIYSGSVAKTAAGYTIG